jgi:methanogenic corrinoid protein MtbC1
MSDTINELRESMIKGDSDLVQTKVRAALDECLPPDEILKEGLI